MKKVFLAIAIVVTTALAASAQNYKHFDGDLPGRYLATQSKLATSPTSPCNKGEEPFITFLKKWNTDAAFRKERVKTADNQPFFDAADKKEMILNQMPYLKQYKALPVAANARTGSTFYAVAADYVGFTFMGGYICFQRIDGKWYVIDLGLAG